MYDSYGTARLGALVRNARTDKGLSRADLAARLELSYGMIAKIELGSRVFPSDKVGQAAKELGVSSDELYAASGELPADIVGQLHELTAERIERIRDVIITAP